MKKRIALLCLLLACCMTAGALAEGTASGGDDVNFADIIALIADNADKAERLNALNTELDALTEENAALAAAIENLSRQNDQLKRQSEEQAGTIENLNASLEALSIEKEALSIERDQLTERLSEMSARLDELEAGRQEASEENLGTVTDAVFTNARRFVLLLKEHGIEYTYYAPDAEHEEEELSMTVGSTSDSGTRFSYVESVFFDRDNSEAGFRVWNLIDFAAADMNSVRRVCDSLNRSFKWTCFYVDTSDNSVTVSLDVPLLDDPRTTDILWDMLTTVDSIIDSGYDLLKPYNITE